MNQDKITIRGARQHNLKNINLEIPRDKLVVITGLSGSGKSSLAFDTIFAEGQRRYVESLSAYARQFLGQMDKPDVDHIEGLSPAISIDQKGASRSPRSTVGTVTEIYDYMRLLYARVGTPHCSSCGREISRQTVQEMTDSILQLPEGTHYMVLGPLIRDRKGEHKKVLDDLRKAGYVRARVDGTIVGTDEEIDLDRYKMHTIEAVVDRLVVRRWPEDDTESRDADRNRLSDSLETALKLGAGVVLVVEEGGREHLFSEKYACPVCNISLPDIEPRTFSFNSPHGACPECTGLGTKQEFDPARIVPDPNLTLNEGALEPWGQASRSEDSYHHQLITSVARHYGFSTNAPWHSLKPEHQHILLYGSGSEAIEMHYTNSQGARYNYHHSFEGVIPNLQRRYSETSSDGMREWMEQFMSTNPCPVCQGKRLKPESLAITVNGLSIDALAHKSILGAGEFIGGLNEVFSERQRTIARDIIKEILARLNFLRNVGLDYLTLDRGAISLSGGEAQRIRLATQIGSQLMGVLYILDEPSIGLHPRDNRKLIETLLQLRDLGNSVLVVEHDEDTIRHADHVIDLGPGAGEHGGYVVFQGSVDELLADHASLTGQFLSGKREVPVPKKRRLGNGKFLEVKGARANNLKNIYVSIPLGCLVVLTGVSGSGKSSLLMDIIHRRLAQDLHRARTAPAPHDDMLGIHHLDKVIDIDQSPIGRTPRSNPATYVDIFNHVRELFASLPESKVRGYKAGRFSFNIKGGRCEACQGAGINRIEMQFLPDVYVPCEVCHGKRYNREALEVLYKGLTIADVLNLTVDEALPFFEKIPAIRPKLETLRDVGLGYVRLGQPATTLSGGEAQRIKLARELSRRATGRTLYILDEPTVGLHMADVERLLSVLNRLVDTGNTVVIIEHNLDIIKSADWLIDLGPEGGDAGGCIIAVGTPEQVAAQESSYTGQALRPLLERSAIVTEPA
ncbi:MAG: excinuclease ABC subunit UvrA [Chloroflexi bacterium]|nr:excinuclease ABC subunit UvrA [Chloroflexota bacterium]